MAATPHGRMIMSFEWEWSMDVRYAQLDQGNGSMIEVRNEDEQKKEGRGVPFYLPLPNHSLCRFMTAQW